MPPTEQNHTPRMRLRTLIVEDSASDARLMENVLRDGGYDVVSERVYTADTLRAALERGPWDIVISDYHLPQFDGPDALQLLQFHAPDIPFIMVSGAVGEESAAGAIRAGADDFLLKSNLGRLVAVVERVLRDAAKRRQSKRMEEALRRSEERYRAVVEDQTELISRYRQDGTLMFVNEVFCRFFGKTSQEVKCLVCGRTVAEPTGGKSKVKARILEVLE